MSVLTQPLQLGAIDVAVALAFRRHPEPPAAGEACLPQAGTSLRSRSTAVSCQESHHKKMSFDAEFLALLKKHNIPFNPKFALA